MWCTSSSETFSQEWDMRTRSSSSPSVCPPFKDRIATGVPHKIALNRDHGFTCIINHKVYSLREDIPFFLQGRRSCIS